MEASDRGGPDSHGLSVTVHLSGLPVSLALSMHSLCRSNQPRIPTGEPGARQQRRPRNGFRALSRNRVFAVRGHVGPRPVQRRRKVRPHRFLTFLQNGGPPVERVTVRARASVPWRSPFLQTCGAHVWSVHAFPDRTGGPGGLRPGRSGFPSLVGPPAGEATDGRLPERIWGHRNAGGTGRGGAWRPAAF